MKSIHKVPLSIVSVLKRRAEHEASAVRPRFADRSRAIASHQVRGLASTTCDAGTVAGSRAAAAAAGFCAAVAAGFCAAVAAGFCTGAAGACAIGSPLAPGMYLRPPLSERSWLTQILGVQQVVERNAQAHMDGDGLDEGHAVPRGAVSKPARSPAGALI